MGLYPEYAGAATADTTGKLEASLLCVGRKALC